MEGVFWAAILIGTVALVGIFFNPVVAILMATVGFIFVGLIGIASISYVAMVAIFCMAVLIMWKVKT